MNSDILPSEIGKYCNEFLSIHSELGVEKNFRKGIQNYLPVELAMKDRLLNEANLSGNELDQLIMFFKPIMRGVFYGIKIKNM